MCSLYCDKRKRTAILLQCHSGVDACARGGKGGPVGIAEIRVEAWKGEAPERGVLSNAGGLLVRSNLK